MTQQISTFVRLHRTFICICKGRLNRFTLINTHTMLVLFIAVAAIALVRFFPQLAAFLSASAARR